VMYRQQSSNPSKSESPLRKEYLFKRAILFQVLSLVSCGCAQHRVHWTSAGLCPHFQGSGPNPANSMRGRRRIRRLVAFSRQIPPLPVPCEEHTGHPRTPEKASGRESMLGRPPAVGPLVL
jgi:hypothetical protein